MGRLRFGQWAWVVVTISLFLFLPACGGHKPPAASPFPVKITLTPSTSTSVQLGTTILFSATATNGSSSAIRPTFTFASSNPGILDISPAGFACAGTWNAPAYTICTPAGIGMVEVTASALGATSSPTMAFVHAAIDNIQISVVPPVNSPPPACPTQQALPAACNLQFNGNAANFCLSQNQVQTLQATAYSQGADITAQVGPFTWSDVNSNVVKLTPIVDSNLNTATNQVTASPITPGQTQLVASASAVSSQPYNFETCPVQCIDLQLTENGSQLNSTTNFVVDKGTSETITATAVDVQGCVVPKPPLTWVSSQPAAISAGTAAAGCVAGTTCTVSTPQPGTATISASCTPPTCNIGFPLNPAGLAAPYIPQPVYPITAISGLVTGATVSTNVVATSQDCYSDPTCAVGIYNIATSNNLPGGATQLPTAPNSFMFDLGGDKAFAGSEFGGFLITPSALGSNTSPFTTLPASGTSLGLVTGKVLAVSNNGVVAIFSDTVSTPNQVYVVSTTPSSTTPLNINSATAAAFSPDGLKAFILGDGGNTLYIYSSLQSLQPIALASPATSILFNSTGSFALLSGGSPAGSLAVYNTCDNSPVSLPLPPPPLGPAGPPLFLRMVPAGDVPLGSTFGNIVIPVNLETAGLDFFFGLDNTGIDIIATNRSLVPLPVPTTVPLLLTTLCPRPIVLAQTTAIPPATFAPVHINIGQGTFHPINFFLSPDATQAYIVASDRSGVLVYNFNTNAVSAIPLVNSATPVAADITVDGTLIYVAGSDGLLHEISIPLSLDQNQISFLPLANSPNSFCYTGSDCALNLVAVKP